VGKFKMKVRGRGEVDYSVRRQPPAYRLGSKASRPT
jgi:hypothetical protein